MVVEPVSYNAVADGNLNVVNPVGGISKALSSLGSIVCSRLRVSPGDVAIGSDGGNGRGRRADNPEEACLLRHMRGTTSQSTAPKAKANRRDIEKGVLIAFSIYVRPTTSSDYARCWGDCKSETAPAPTPCALVERGQVSLTLAQSGRPYPQWRGLAEGLEGQGEGRGEGGSTEGRSRSHASVPVWELVPYLL